MNFVKVLPILFLHVLSLELIPLVVLSDTCTRLLESEPDGLEPNCKFETSKSAGDLVVTCPEPGVLRIVGDYDVIRIDCQAAFPFDFHFSGTKPTEAVVPEFYRQLDATTEDWDYHIEVFIYGLNALARLHNSELKHKYSRTGRFSFQGLGNFDRIEKSFYIFLEEPELSANFITNRETEWPRFEDNNVCAKIQCLSTHYQSVVSLASPEFPGISSVYKPTTGLRVCGLSSRVEAFTCQLQADGSVVSKTVQSVPSSYGFLSPLAESSDVNISYSSRWRDNTTIETFAECSVRTGSHLATIGASNAASYRLLRDFVLPAFQSRSYSVLIGQNVTDGRLTTSTTTAFAGATYCGDTERYRLASFIVDFEPSVTVMDFNIDWTSFFSSPSHSNAKYSKMLPNGSEQLEEDSDVNFTCIFNNFLFVPPAVWHVETTNGSVRRELENRDTWEDGVSVRHLKVTKDLQEVSCNAPVWYLNSMEPTRAILTIVSTKPAPQRSTEDIATTTTTITPMITHDPGILTTVEVTTFAASSPKTTTTTKSASPEVPTTLTTDTPLISTTAASTKIERSTTTPAGNGVKYTAVIVIAVVAGLLLCGTLAMLVRRYGIAAVTRRLGRRSTNITGAGSPQSPSNGSTSSNYFLPQGPTSEKHADGSNLKPLLPFENESARDEVSTRNQTFLKYSAPLASLDETTL